MDHEQLSVVISHSLGNKLVKAGRLFQNHCLEEVKSSMNVEGIKPSHLRVFPFIKDEGSTVVEVAQSLNISKQATSLLISELIEFKVLVKEDHPLDKRSFLVKFNHKRGSAFLKGAKIFSKQDKLLEELLSQKEISSLESSLNKILSFLEAK